jgi:hypothetical protein
MQHSGCLSQFQIKRKRLHAVPGVKPQDELLRVVRQHAHVLLLSTNEVNGLSIHPHVCEAMPATTRQAYWAVAHVVLLTVLDALS